MPKYYLQAANPDFLTWLKGKGELADVIPGPRADVPVAVLDLRDDHSVFVLGIQWADYLASPEGKAMLRKHNETYLREMLAKFEALVPKDGSEPNEGVIVSLEYYREELAKLASE